MPSFIQSGDQLTDWIGDVLADQKEHTIQDIFDAVSQQHADKGVKLHAVYTALAGLVGNRKVALTASRKYQLVQSPR